jgi:hypothetical protein
MDGRGSQEASQAAGRAARESTRLLGMLPWGACAVGSAFVVWLPIDQALSVRQAIGLLGMLIVALRLCLNHRLDCKALETLDGDRIVRYTAIRAGMDPWWDGARGGQPVSQGRRLVGGEGFEPPTSSMSSGTSKLALSLCSVSSIGAR